jgi:hypothetical protein
MLSCKLLAVMENLDGEVVTDNQAVMAYRERVRLERKMQL